MLLIGLTLLGLTVYCAVDAARTPAHEVLGAPRWCWLAGILLLPVAGPAGWLLLGRPHRARHRRPVWPALPVDGAPAGPDDDPDFLDSLRSRGGTPPEGREKDR